MNHIIQFIFMLYYRAKYGLLYILSRLKLVFQLILFVFLFVYTQIKRFILFIITWIHKQIITTSTLYWFVLRNFITLCILVGSIFIYLIFKNPFFVSLLILANILGMLWLLYKQKNNQYFDELFGFLSVHQFIILFFLLNQKTYDIFTFTLTIVAFSLHLAHLLTQVRYVNFTSKKLASLLHVSNFILTSVITCILALHSIFAAINLTTMYFIKTMSSIFPTSQMNYIFLLIFISLLMIGCIITFTLGIYRLFKLRKPIHIENLHSLK